MFSIDIVHHHNRCYYTAGKCSCQGILLDKVFKVRGSGLWWRLRRDRGLRSQLFWHSLSHIRRFSPLRMTKRGDARRSLDSSFSSYRSLPHWGRGTASAVDRVLSFIVDLRRSFPLFFIPLEPYPAPSARHLPHAGKALIQKYHFPHPTSAPSGHLLPPEGGCIHASPFPWKGLPSAARRGWLPFLRRSRLLFSFQAVFRV